MTVVALRPVMVDVSNNVPQQIRNDHCSSIKTTLQSQIPLSSCVISKGKVGLSSLKFIPKESSSFVSLAPRYSKSYLSLDSGRSWASPTAYPNFFSRPFLILRI